MSEPEEVIVIHTDGGAEPNPGVGGWGAVIDARVSGGERRELSGGEDWTTNNRMELTAAIRALEAVPSGQRVELHTDSSYLRLGITQWLRRWKAEGWRTRAGEPVKNEDLWRELEAAAARHRVRWRWVRGHSGDSGNERAHTLASAEIERRRPRRGAGVDPEREAAAAADPGAGAGPVGVEVLLKLSCVAGRGAWAALVRRAGGETVLGSAATGVTANRLELLAAEEVLAVLPPSERVEWRGGSDYLREGASKWLAGWKRRGYRTSGGDPVKNADVWRRLERELTVRRLTFRPAGPEDAPDLSRLEREVRRRLAGGR